MLPNKKKNVPIIYEIALAKLYFMHFKTLIYEKNFVT